MRALILLFAALCVFPASAAETVRLVADRWCPYNCEPDSKQPGFMVEIARKALARYDITVEYTVQPWSKALDMVRAGKADAAIGASYKDAPDFIFPEIPQGRMVNRFYVRAGDKWRFESLRSLESITLGAVAGYTYDGGMLDVYIQTASADAKRIALAEGDNAVAANVKKLLDKKLGALIEDERVMAWFLQTHRLKGRVESAGLLPATGNSDLFIAFSPALPNSRKYAELLARETEAMRKSGELAAILARYGAKDWK